MTTVIYHSADYDGIFCREIARRALGDKQVNYVGWNFGDLPLVIPPEGEIYILDLPVDRAFGFEFSKPETVLAFVGVEKMDKLQSRLVWIDHHKSSIESHPGEIYGYRLDGVAACRLAWQWFYHLRLEPTDGLPLKEDYLHRKLVEPLAVRLAGEYDVWDHRGDGDLELQFGLRAADGELNWDLLLSSHDSYTNLLIREGRVAQRYQQRMDADLVKYRSYQMEWEGLRWLVLNTGRFNSLTFAAVDRPETGHDALLGYMFNGKVWTVSLYHAAHRKELDLSLIAVKHGGGGHKGACGFTCAELPWGRKPAEHAEDAEGEV